MRRKREQWDETFLDEMMDEIRDGILEVWRARSRRAREQVVTLQEPGLTVTITIKAERPIRRAAKVIA